MNFEHTTFISPLTWRYGSDDMRTIWSEWNKRRTMRQVWVALASAQNKAGLVTDEELQDLRSQMDQVRIDRALAIEKVTRHDVMAEIRTYAEQCPVGGGIIHWGATSADITDNVDVLRMRQACDLLILRIAKLLLILKSRILETADMPAMAYTHIQPAEPTTLGYRFAFYAQDILEDYRRLVELKSSLKGKGLKGAVGTQAGFQDVLVASSMDAVEMEAAAMEILNLPYYTIASQTYTRQQDLRVQQVLAGLAASLHKFALDFRMLQTPSIGEWAEPFAKGQVGSSAMPFKRNPINAENICSLARYLAAMPGIAWQNAAQAILERSLDDSANRRLMQAESFLVADELLRRSIRILEDILINKDAMAKNLARFGPFAASERILMALVKAGASRQDGHEWLREMSLRAWEAVQGGEENPLPDLIAADDQVRQYLSLETIQQLMDVSAYTGTAAQRARALAGEIDLVLE
ncbi:MAG: adenylosuccinate lyase [Candidatus Promineifilaceae bacterium]|nr:adenylosuccinate lyase [Candidatus Promineifilaceae bacterium]